MTTLEDFAGLAGGEQGLVTVATTRADGSVQASLVNAGVLEDPATGVRAVGFVTYGKVKLANLRARPRIAVSVRSGWQWATVEGAARIIGPDDPADGIDGERLRLLLREVFTAAGGTHEDWDEYDRVMVEQRRAVVLVAPERVYSN
ncbi:TIGR03618 family F420-dependent PPOX class oxidoreductase [Actinoplanes sp. LDG1-06]|uniref:TIGR03618 family F420-dependent PPOX class oxidoreductase n=1 Tax=Paractinoplanes ovalisporus TaxID=2810368 RepID=A0ABS2A4H5_9ACTN|nr:TIGR03618 family F420-dependent PPOX class oxidoreductase [Actinoplanes ovalisporus]MBM2614741.1 TIGR03618 family F420-dependent PPOX class oxidoreductase [Actinoplanes ovalisporus]